MDTILVVEDERAIREMLGQGLRIRDEVLVAEDGDEALRMCAKHHKPIQLLLCDVVTPGLTTASSSLQQPGSEDSESDSSG